MKTALLEDSPMLRWRGANQAAGTATRNAPVLGSLERLEERDCPADLAGYGFGLSAASAAAGAQVVASWSVVNYEWDQINTDFNVAIFLSRDASFGPGDLMLSQRWMPPGFPGNYVLPTQYDTLTLPEASNPWWTGSGTYHLGLWVDNTHRVWEWDEDNNSGVGIGWDHAQISITLPGGGGDDGGGDDGGGGGGAGYTRLADLPATGQPAGSVLRGALHALQGYLGQVVRQESNLRASIGRMVTLPNQNPNLRNLATNLGALNRLLTPLTTGKATSVKLAPDLTLNQSELGIIERYLSYYLTDASGDGGALGPSGSRAPTTASDPPLTDWRTWMPSAAKTADEVGNWVADKKQKFDQLSTDIAASTSKVGKWVMGLFTGATEAATHIERQAKTIAEGGADLDTRIQELQAEAAQSFEDRLSAAAGQLNAKAGSMLSSATNQLKNLFENGHQATQALAAELGALTQRELNRGFAGAWKGDMSGPDPFGGTSTVKMSIKFKKPSGADPMPGTISFPILYYGLDGRVIRTVQKTLNFKGSIDEAGNFHGTARLFNAMAGQYEDKTMTWSLLNGELSGAMYEGSLSNFSLKRLSGADWVKEFPGSRKLSQLDDEFEANVRKFRNALKGQATVDVLSTMRPPERAYLMHHAWMIWKGKESAASVDAKAGVSIEWWHGSEASSRQAAYEMVKAFGISKLDVAPALNSNHTQGKALDMAITWKSAKITVKDADGNPVIIDSGPKDSTNPKLIEIANTYKVKHFTNAAKDKNHWSVDGR